MRSSAWNIAIFVVLFTLVSATSARAMPPRPSLPVWNKIFSATNNRQQESSSVSKSKNLSPLIWQTGIATVTEAGGLLALLFGAEQLAKLPKTPGFLRHIVKGLPVVQWISVLWTIFGTSTIKSLVDGGISESSRQALQPNVVPGNPNWYAKLQKPWFNPPGWLFPIMWLLVSKPTQMLSVRRVLLLPTESVGTRKWSALAVYCCHLATGDTWNQVFFGNQQIKLGVGVISIFWSLLVTSVGLFTELDQKAGLWLVPTLGWVTVASALNWEIYRLNGDV